MRLLTLLASAAYAAPSLTLATDRTKFAVGDKATLTLTYTVPTADALGQSNVFLGYTAPAGFSLVSATGPKLITNTATATSDQGSTTSAPVSFRVLAATQAVVPVGSAVSIPVGDVPPGDSVTATVQVQRAN